VCTHILLSSYIRLLRVPYFSAYLLLVYTGMAALYDRTDSFLPDMPAAAAATYNVTQLGRALRPSVHISVAETADGNIKTGGVRILRFHRTFLIVYIHSSLYEHVRPTHSCEMVLGPRPTRKTFWCDKQLYSSTASLAIRLL